MLGGHYDDAIKAFRAAADIEDTTVVATSHDPPVFWYPVRRSLALALSKAGKTQDALNEITHVLGGVSLDRGDAWPGEPLTLLLRSRLETDSGAAK